MGCVTIELNGSFSKHAITVFSAEQGGHARAIADAIAWLSGIALPEAIIQDHRLQSSGYYPKDNFGIEDSAKDSVPEPPKRGEKPSREYLDYMKSPESF